MAIGADRDEIATWARVAVERGVDRYPDGLTYAVPASLGVLSPGERVIVPLGRGDTPTPGYVIESTGSPGLDPATVKPVLRRDDTAPALPRDLVDLARWISGYYMAPLGVSLAAMMPAAVRRGVGRIERRMIDLAPGAPTASGLTAKQRRLVEVLQEMAPTQRPVEAMALADLAGVRTRGPIERLVGRGVLLETRRTTIEAAWSARALHETVPEQLTEAQATAVERIGSVLEAGMSTHVLWGVTASGKTEVYIQLIMRVLDRGGVAMVLVPEIALTPQTGGRLIARFPSHRVAILHSALTASQRHQQWARCASGEADIVLGARSAVFAPIPIDRLGLVVVDEEHDGSYKQDRQPRYHGRDVAIRRAQVAGCPIILGSATPSLETWHNATRRGVSTLHRLPERVPGMRLPRVHVVDFAQERALRSDRRIHLLGPTLESAMRHTLDAGGQALLLLNRRGFANYITCPSSRCGWFMTCDHCDVTTVYHRHRGLPSGGYVRCHHCLTEQRLPAACPECGGRIVTFGLGTQRVEAELVRKFPQLVVGRTLLRVDSDTMQRGADFHEALDDFAAGTVRVLVGTQMIAKGLDFPGVRLVGVVDADTAINLPDFRASERTFQLVSQVSGRCGRGQDPGVAIVQTFNPSLDAIRLAAAHDYERFADLELQARQRCGLPPVTRMARIVLQDADHARGVAAAGRLAESLRGLDPAGGLRLEGPAPCPIARIADRHRTQLELFAPEAGLLQGVLAGARNRGLLRGRGVLVDVDPIALL